MLRRRSQRPAELRRAQAASPAPRWRARPASATSRGHGGAPRTSRSREWRDPAALASSGHARIEAARGRGWCRCQGGPPDSGEVHRRLGTAIHSSSSAAREWPSGLSSPIRRRRESTLRHPARVRPSLRDATIGSSDKAAVEKLLLRIPSRCCYLRGALQLRDATPSSSGEHPRERDKESYRHASRRAPSLAGDNAAGRLDAD